MVLTFSKTFDKLYSEADNREFTFGFPFDLLSKTSASVFFDNLFPPVLGYDHILPLFVKGDKAGVPA